MKKITLFILGATMVFGAQAQSGNTATSKMGTATVKMANDLLGSGTATPGTKTRKTRDAFPSTLGTKEVAGKSTYDLQTNGSMQRRIIQNGTKISCGWTYSSEQGVVATSPFADRGTGYAHYDGTNWSGMPTARLEPVRVGFGGLVLDGAGNEMYISHDPAANQLNLAKKSGSSWANSTMTTTNANAPIWPHTATSGNWMYIIASPSDSNIHTNGIRNGYFFARSNDNGNTWIDNMIPMPQVDSVGHYRGGGNSYAISANGNYVSIIFGDIGTDLTLLTSSNNGATWTKKVVWDWPIANYNFAGTAPTDANNDGTIDTLFTLDGAHSLVVDASGVSHVAFSMLRVRKDGTSTSYNYFPLTSLVAYYNTAVDSIQVVDDIFASVHDCDKNGTVEEGASYALASGPDAAYNTLSLVTMPCISIVPGAPQKVLISYAAIMDNDTTVDDGIHPYWFGSSSLAGQPYRDILVVGSNDNGGTWLNPVNISRTAHFEEAFVVAPEIVSGSKIAFLYQGDIEPGTILQNDDLYDNDFQNFMIVQQVNISDIFTLGLDTTAVCNQFELPLGVKTILQGGIGIVNVYPNPSTDYINLSMKFINTAEFVNINIVDIAGNVVYTSNMKNVTEDSKRIDVAAFASGLYMVHVTTNAGTVSNKFIKD